MMTGGNMFVVFVLAGTLAALASPVTPVTRDYIPSASVTPTPTAEPTPSATPLPTPSASPFCIGKLTDICIAADASTSLGRTGWNSQRRFIKRMIQGIESTYPEQGEIRFGGNIFGTSIYDTINFRKFGGKVIQFYKSFAYTRGWTRIDRALRKCRKQYERNGKAGSEFTVVLISDGNARKSGNVQIPFADLDVEAQALKAAGARIFSIGAGDDGYEAILEGLSGEQGSNDIYYYSIDEVTNFSNLARQLVQAEECREGLGFDLGDVVIAR